jgi:hypothetical protein
LHAALHAFSHAFLHARLHTFLRQRLRPVLAAPPRVADTSRLHDPDRMGASFRCRATCADRGHRTHPAISLPLHAVSSHCQKTVESDMRGHGIFSTGLG